jgi:SAM-dependent methyltransferase
LDDPRTAGTSGPGKEARDLDDSLTVRWNAASEALEHDSMRPIRYAKCFRYLADTIDKEARILEVGCGEGTGLVMLGQLGFRRLFGVEVSGKRLTSAAIKLPREVHLHRISPTGRLPFEDNYFDAVVTAAVIEHTVDRKEFIRELSRVAKPGGCVVVSSDCYSWRVLQVLGAYRSVQPIDRAPFPLTLIREFKLSGLTLLHCEGFPLPGQEYRFLRRLAAQARSLAGQAAKLAVRLFGKKTPIRKPGPLPAQAASQPGDAAALVRGERWQPSSFVASLPRLLFSDENVFFLRKQCNTGS